MMKRYPFILIIIFTFILNGCAADRQKKFEQAIQIDNNLPHDPFSAQLVASKNIASAKDFDTILLNGKTFQLSQKQGNVVILNIWATWCPPCVEETSDLVDIYEKYKDEGLVVLGISIDEQGKSVVEPFVEKYDITYPVTIDDGTILEKYGPLIGIPTTYIIGKKGNLRYFATGAITKKELAPRIEQLLEE